MVIGQWLSSAGLGVAVATVASLALEPLVAPDQPLINLRGLEVVEDSVVFTRTVNSADVVRAPFYGSVVDVETETGVPECERIGAADYGPQEPERQVFAFARFFSADCAAALKIGTEYRPFAAVTPLDGIGDTFYGEPFVWTGQ